MNIDYKLVKATQVEDFHRPYWQQFPPEPDRAITLPDTKILRSHALRLFKNLGPVRVAILDKAMYSVGRHWQPKYLGEDTAYGAVAVPWLLENWYPICNVLGPEFDLITSLNLMSIHLDVFGEVFVYLTETPDGYPQIQLIPCYRVDQPRQSGAINSKGQLTGVCFRGLFAGCQMVSGVVKNPQGRAIAYHVLGNTEAEDTLVSADDLLRLRELDLGVDETRATPTMSHGINQGRSILSLLENEQEFLEAATRIALIESNDLGGVDLNDPQNGLAVRPAPPTGVGEGEDGAPNNATAPVYAEEWNQTAQTRYFKSKSGGSVAAFQFNRPAKEWGEFISKLSRFLVDSIWPYQLIDKEAELGSAMARGVIARANRLVYDRQDLLGRVAKRVIQYAVAKGSKLGRIPQSDNWYQWGFTYPARITVDFGRDVKSELLEVEARTRDRAEMVEERGCGVYADWLLNYYRNAATDILIREQVQKEMNVDLSSYAQAGPLISGSGNADATE